MKALGTVHLKPALQKRLSITYRLSKKSTTSFLNSPVLDEILDKGAVKANAIASVTVGKMESRDGTRT